MHKVAIVGAGHIGRTICKYLVESGDYEVSILDRSQAQLDQIPNLSEIDTHCVDVFDSNVLSGRLGALEAVVNAAPDHLTLAIAKACIKMEIPYLDLTADVDSTREVHLLAEKRRSSVITQCGLAPGFVSIVANNLAESFDLADTLSIRVGALPRIPTNPFKYNLTWSTEGLVNEYCQPCTEIVDGELSSTRPFERYEEFSLSEVAYESFSTSGGIGTLAQSLLGKVSNLNYQTIRYPGHRAIMKFLLQDLELEQKPEYFKDFLEHVIPTTDQDIVLIYVSCEGTKNGQRTRETYTQKIDAQVVQKEHLSAIQITTASGVCTVLDLLIEGKLPRHGIVLQEQIELDAFLENRFGRCFRHATRLERNLTS